MVCPHTHNHVFLKDINDENAAKRELLAPKEILQDLLHRKINAFAFPVGTEKQAGRYAYDFIQRNYAFCFTALNGTNTLKTSPHLLFRDCLPAEAPLYYIRMIMDGSYDIFYMRKMKRLINSVQGKRIRNINSNYKSSKHMDIQNSLTGQQNTFNHV
jgi:peptidoglycan/xylan/chitin deacetylase (PgdA/CDA1 family)